MVIYAYSVEIACWNIKNVFELLTYTKNKKIRVHNQILAQNYWMKFLKLRLIKNHFYKYTRLIHKKEENVLLVVMHNKFIWL